MPNPDGTVQVAPPTMSAFSPQASASAPPPPRPVQAQAPDPGAIANLVAMLAKVFAPRSIVQRPQVLQQQQQQAEGLGNEFHQ